MSKGDQRQRAQRFRELHRGPRILVLPNAWDAASARVFEDAGFQAVGTTSAGVAFSLGYPDGERAPFEEVIAVVRRIVAAVDIPVSADLEAGFGAAAAEVAERCRMVLEAGAVGVNLEDGTGDPDDPLCGVEAHCEKIRAARQAGEGVHQELFVNARTDVFLRAVGPPEQRFEEAVRRCNAYRDAGAGCLFVPGVSDGETIGRLAHAIRGPVNMLAGPGVPPVAELERLGVARVSLGSGPMRASLDLLRSIGRELQERGTYTAMSQALPYAEANALFRSR